MLLCAKVVGAKKGLIYVRAEYAEARAAMEKAVAEARAKGVLAGVELAVFGGAGAYVCGEETALLCSLESKRGEPALKPPYPGVKGLYGCPTVINNAESFAAAAAYLRSGKLSKLYTVTGCVEYPGVYEMPCGTPIRILAEKAGVSPSVCGLQLGGGATGAILGKGCFGLELSFASCREAGISLGTGSLLFFDKAEDAVSLSAKSLEFLAGQSCGKCVPCRLGTAELAQLLTKFRAGKATAADWQRTTSLCRYLAASARCGLGQSAANAAATAIENFSPVFAAQTV